MTATGVITTTGVALTGTDLNLVSISEGYPVNCAEYISTRLKPQYFENLKVAARFFRHMA